MAEFGHAAQKAKGSCGVMARAQIMYLEDQALDWVAAMCVEGSIRTENGIFLNQGCGYDYFTPSTDKEQAEKIIKRFHISCFRWVPWPTERWWAVIRDEQMREVAAAWGHTRQVAAMRCCGIARFGREVALPKALLERSEAARRMRRALSETPEPRRERNRG